MPQGPQEQTNRPSEQSQRLSGGKYLNYMKVGTDKSGNAFCPRMKHFLSRTQVAEDSVRKHSLSKCQELDKLDQHINSTRIKIHFGQGQFMDMKLAIVLRGQPGIAYNQGLFYRDEEGRHAPYRQLAIDHKIKADHSIDQRSSSIHVLMSVYLERHPHCIHEMLECPSSLEMYIIINNNT